MFIFENKMIITKYHSIISLHENILFLSVYNYKHDLIMYFSRVCLVSAITVDFSLPVLILPATSTEI